MTMLGLRSHGRLGLSPRRARRPEAGPPGDAEAPSVPQNLVATAVSSSQIDLIWDASSDNVAVTGYNIYRDNVLVDTSPTNAYSDTGLDPGTEYEYEVSAFDAASNESAPSAPDSATTHQVIVADGLIAEWRFDAGAGQIVTDHSGNGYNAILGPTAGADASEPTWSSTGVDCVLNAANNYISTGSNMGISGGAARTVIVVAQVDTNFSGSNTGYGFFKWTGAASAGARWVLRTAASAANLRFETTFGQGHTSSLVLSDETWHFIAARQSGAGADTIKLYLDGASENSANVTTLNTSGNAFMGPNAVADNGNNKWGRHAYALVYNRALSDAEVEQNRQALKAILAGRGITLP
jgi:Fibronectin type III domain